MSELFYLDNEGNNVKTAQFLRNRGSCCKTNCLHCPYGTTIKNLGLEFQQLKLSDLNAGNLIIKEAIGDTDTIGASLINSAFGNQSAEKVTKFNFDQFHFFLLKGKVAGLAKKGRLQVKKIYLKQHFQDQGLDLSTVESLF